MVIEYVPGSEKQFYDVPTFFSIDENWDTNIYYPNNATNDNFLAKGNINAYKSTPSENFGTASFIKTYGDDY